MCSGSRGNQSLNDSRADGLCFRSGADGSLPRVPGCGLEQAIVVSCLLADGLKQGWSYSIQYGHVDSAKSRCCYGSVIETAWYPIQLKKLIACWATFGMPCEGRFLEDIVLRETWMPDFHGEYFFTPTFQRMSFLGMNGLEPLLFLIFRCDVLSYCLLLCSTSLSCWVSGEQEGKGLRRMRHGCFRHSQAGYISAQPTPALWPQPVSVSQFPILGQDKPT